MKQTLRNEIKAAVKGYLPLIDTQDAAQNLLNHLKPLLDTSSNIAIYHACDYEISLKYVIDYCISLGKELFQPVAYKQSKNMLLEKYNPNHTDIFSSEEFIPKDGYEWYNLDLILLPLIAVDKYGARLGKGGGYYDTTLSKISNKKSHPKLCGVGFDIQLVENIPTEKWDVKLNYFASEKQLIKF